MTRAKDVTRATVNALADEYLAVAEARRRLQVLTLGILLFGPAPSPFEREIIADIVRHETALFPVERAYVDQKTERAAVALVAHLRAIAELVGGWVIMRGGGDSAPVTH